MDEDRDSFLVDQSSVVWCEYFKMDQTEDPVQIVCTKHCVEGHQDETRTESVKKFAGLKQT